MAESIADRAIALFNQARANTSRDLRQVMTERNHAGELYSGATIKHYVEVHRSASRQALVAATESIGRRAKSRGIRWRRMVADVGRELDNHLDSAEQLLDGEMLKILPDGPKLSKPLLAAVREQLHRDLDDYREGWTGTPGRSWSERNKVLYSLLMMLIGAALPYVPSIASKIVAVALNIAN